MTKQGTRLCAFVRSDWVKGATDTDWPLMKNGTRPGTRAARLSARASGGPSLIEVEMDNFVIECK